jgi:hypothetical protein
MTLQSLISPLGPWLRRLVAGGIAIGFIIAVSSCGQPRVERPASIASAPLANPQTVSAYSGKLISQFPQGPIGRVEPSWEELNQQAADSLDRAAEDTTDAFEETTIQLKQSLEETAEAASESLQELNQEAADVLDDEASKAADAIHAEIERAKNQQP